VPSLSKYFYATPQIAGYDYTDGSPSGYGSNFQQAWRYEDGTGVTVALLDTGFTPVNLAHWSPLSRDFSGSGTVSDAGVHGSTTADLIGAADFTGVPGLAQGATILGAKIALGSAPGSGDIGQYAQALAYSASHAAIVSNSWGYNGFGMGSPADPHDAPWYNALQTAVSAGRGGLGTVVIFAAGNGAGNGDDLAVQPMPSDFREIAVGATDQTGSRATFSTPGAAVLVSALGSADTLVMPDRGIQPGYGTSYAAPTVAAAAALMLQANPGLGWRDVQEILGDSAYVRPALLTAFTRNGAADWNGVGRHFADGLGFGTVDANVAVSLAKAWADQRAAGTSATMAAWTIDERSPVTVGAGQRAASTVQATAPLRVQHVSVTLADSGLLDAYTKLTLTSPDGTQSVLANRPGWTGIDQTGGQDLTGSVITSNAFWGEQGQGTWTLSAENASGTAAVLHGWGLKLEGDAGAGSAPLVYTPEFASIAASAATVPVVGGNGATTLDLAALPGATIINLGGGAGTLDGVAVQVQAGLHTVDAYGSTGALDVTMGATGGTVHAGDGALTVHESAGAGIVSAGSGGSTIYGNTGALDFTGGAGADILVLTSGQAGGPIVGRGFQLGTDTIRLVGYRLDGVQAALGNAIGDGTGGTNVTLADGTRIDVQGIAKAAVAQVFDMPQLQAAPPAIPSAPPAPAPAPVPAPVSPGLPPAPTPDVTPANMGSFAISDETLGTTSHLSGNAYAGPVPYLRQELLWNSDDSVNVAASQPDVFIKSGAGNDALHAVLGGNVLDGGAGSNFLVGGLQAYFGQNDTFFLDGRDPSRVTWSTVVNFHAGDTVTLWGFVPGKSAFSWGTGAEGAAGYQGATLHAETGGAGTGVNASMTFAGLNQADTANLAMSSGTAGGESYLSLVRI
jgi:subtilisin-like proprotein convertase family protein